MKRLLYCFTASLVFAAVALPIVGQGFVLGGYRWPVAQVPYYVNPANADVSEAAALAAIQAGAATWSAQSNANFSFYYAGRTSGGSMTLNYKNEVFFRSTTSGGLVADTMRWMDGAGNLLDTDIVFYDGGWQFFAGSSGCSGGVYLEDFAAHEFGHALGLRHSPVPTATMYAVGSNCSTSWRSLDSDDLAGVEALYPPTSSNAGPSVSISSPSSGTSVSEGTSLTFSGSATDKEDGNLSSRINWNSSIDGQIGSGSSFSRTLSAGSHTVTATVTDGAGATQSAWIALTVQASAPSPQPPSGGGLALQAQGYKIKGRQHVDLTWTGATSSNIDIYRDGTRIMTAPNDGSATDAINRKGAGSYAYTVCETGTTRCSNASQVVF